MFWEDVAEFVTAFWDDVAEILEKTELVVVDEVLREDAVTLEEVESAEMGEVLEDATIEEVNARRQAEVTIDAGYFRRSTGTEAATARLRFWSMAAWELADDTAELQYDSSFDRLISAIAWLTAPAESPTSGSIPGSILA
jgi:hypothetical protein